MPITVTVTDGSDSKALRLSARLVNDFSLTAEGIRDVCKLAIIASIFDPAAHAQYVGQNIEEID